MLLELRKLNIPPGHQLLLQDLSWQEFEAILQELGEGRSACLSYSNGTLEIMTPLMGHGHRLCCRGECSRDVRGILMS